MMPSQSPGYGAIVFLIIVLLIGAVVLGFLASGTVGPKADAEAGRIDVETQLYQTEIQQEQQFAQTQADYDSQRFALDLDTHQKEQAIRLAALPDQLAAQQKRAERNALIKNLLLTAGVGAAILSLGILSLALTYRQLQVARAHQIVRFAERREAELRQAEDHWYTGANNPVRDQLAQAYRDIDTLTHDLNTAYNGLDELSQEYAVLFQLLEQTEFERDQYKNELEVTRAEFTSTQSPIRQRTPRSTCERQPGRNGRLH